MHFNYCKIVKLIELKIIEINFKSKTKLFKKKVTAQVKNTELIEFSYLSSPAATNIVTDFDSVLLVSAPVNTVEKVE